MYLPIALACWWWGRRGTFVTLTLAAVVAAFHLVGLGLGTLWNDVARIGSFAVVSLAIGELRERAAAGEQALQSSERRYRMLLSKALKGILVCREGRVLFTNDHLCRMMARRPEELVGRSVAGLVAAEDAGRLQEILRLQDPQLPPADHQELRLRRPGGQTLWVEVSGCSTDFEGAEAVLLNLHDVTARKEAESRRRELAELARRQEEQLEHSTRLAELGEMAAAISHELNQPLTGIRNYARNAFYMLDQGLGSSSEVKSNLRLISEQVDRAAKIISEMRQLTRRSEKHFARVDLNGVIRESVDFLLPQMKLSGVEVQLCLDPDLPVTWGDRIRLAQVFLNLLNNARQAMEGSGTRRLRVSSHGDESGRLLVAEVRDTGKGFSEEEARNLFVPFYTTKKTSGTGLGLSISRNIIKDHGGTIEAAGAPQGGATFTVRLPATTEDAQ